MINELKEENLKLKVQNETLQLRIEKIETLLVKNGTK